LVQNSVTYFMDGTGGDLGELGETVPQNLRWGIAHASVPPIFWEAVLGYMEACESTKRKKNEHLCVWNRRFRE